MKTTAVFLLCLTGGLAFADGDEDDRINAIVERLREAEYAHQRRELYRTLFVTAGADGLTRLQTLPDDSVAIQAAWEAVNLTVPVNDGVGSYRPDVQTLHWFIGYFQGRARVSPPDCWRDVVLDARANQRDSIYPGKPRAYPYRRAEIASVNCPRHACVKRNGSDCVYQVGGDQVTIPKKILDYYLDDEGELSCNISGCFTDEQCFIAIHGDMGLPHVLACVDRPSSDLVWQSEVCGCWWSGGTGIHESWVELKQTTDERVFVFGAASIGLYAHCFRASDGKSLLQFSSNY